MEYIITRDRYYDLNETFLKVYDMYTLMNNYMTELCETYNKAVANIDKSILKRHKLKKKDLEYFYPIRIYSDHKIFYRQFILKEISYEKIMEFYKDLDIKPILNLADMNELLDSKCLCRYGDKLFVPRRWYGFTNNLDVLECMRNPSLYQPKPDSFTADDINLYDTINQLYHEHIHKRLKEYYKEVVI